jgi:hypothetical protein
MGQPSNTSQEIHSVIRFFCDRVRALRKWAACFQAETFNDKRRNPAAMRPTRLFYLSYTFYSQLYPQVTALLTPRKRIILYLGTTEDPTCGVFEEIAQPHKWLEIQAFYC